MRVVGLVLAGTFAIAVPIAGHADGPKLNLRPANQGATSNILPVWEGAAVPAGTRGRLAATRRPAERSNGTGDLIGNQTAVLSAGVGMPGKVSQLIGSGFLGVRSSITRSPTGGVRPAGGVIRSRWG
jgi:hypothetical protein